MRITLPRGCGFEIEAALFDLDGTLVDTLPDFALDRPDHLFGGRPAPHAVR